MEPQKELKSEKEVSSIQETSPFIKLGLEFEFEARIVRYFSAVKVAYLVEQNRGLGRLGKARSCWKETFV
jgi:hypothetical protein